MAEKPKQSQKIRTKNMAKPIQKKQQHMLGAIPTKKNRTRQAARRPYDLGQKKRTQKY